MKVLATLNTNCSTAIVRSRSARQYVGTDVDREFKETSHEIEKRSVYLSSKCATNLLSLTASSLRSFLCPSDNKYWVKMIEWIIKKVCLKRPT